MKSDDDRSSSEIEEISGLNSSCDGMEEDNGDNLCHDGETEEDADHLRAPVVKLRQKRKPDKGLIEGIDFKTHTRTSVPYVSPRS